MPSELKGNKEALEPVKKNLRKKLYIICSTMSITFSLTLEVSKSTRSLLI